MAIIRKSLDELLNNPPSVDHAKLAATTEAEIRQHMIEDGQDPDAPLEAFELDVPAKLVREKLRRAYGSRLGAGKNPWQGRQCRGSSI